MGVQSLSVEPCFRFGDVFILDIYLTPFIKINLDC